VALLDSLVHTLDYTLGAALQVQAEVRDMEVEAACRL
jgi:hypothetical protein